MFSYKNWDKIYLALSLCDLKGEKLENYQGFYSLGLLCIVFFPN